MPDTFSLGAPSCMAFNTVYIPRQAEISTSTSCAPSGNEKCTALRQEEANESVASHSPPLVGQSA